MEYPESVSSTDELNPSASFFDQDSQLLQDNIQLEIQYEPPVITISDEKSSSDEDEVPASVRYELQPTNSLGNPGISYDSPFSKIQRSRPLKSFRKLAQELYLSPPLLNPSVNIPNNSHAPNAPITIKAWTDVTDLDRFLSSLYQYYLSKGLFCTVSSQISNLLITLFIVAFSSFLFGCIDYSIVHQKHLLAEIIFPNCIYNLHWIHKLCLISFGFWWFYNVFRLHVEYQTLAEIQSFYTNVLGLNDDDISTMNWKDITTKIIKTYEQSMASFRFRGQLLAKKLDEHAIANRILRKENYLIALFNKDILDLSIPPLSGNRQILTKIVEWSLSVCILSFVFDEKGQVKKRFLKDANRYRLTEGLQKRFMIMGLLSFLLAPFLFIFLILHFFFRYAQEYHKNPSSLGTRQYSPWARWKFREFNEFSHLFNARLNRSYEKAGNYLDQFPKMHLIIYAKFISFISGSFAAVLLIATILNQDLLHNFEITRGYSSFFYITIFGGLAAASNGLIPSENQVYDPEKIAREVADETHYMPQEWHGKLHTNQIRNEFSLLFENKIVLFVQELLSVFTAPYILFFQLPKCSDKIIGFFREFSVHVDSLGYVCSFAVFDFKRHGNTNYGAPTSNNDGYLASKGGKMESSFLSFKQRNPEWDPGLEGSAYLATVLSKNGSPEMPQESMMGASMWSNEGNQTAGNNLFRLLDAVYESNKNIL